MKNSASSLMTRNARFWICSSILLPALLATQGVPGADNLPSVPSDPDEEFLRRHAQPTDDASLIVFLQRRSIPGGTRDNITQLVEKLGSNEFEERETSQARLLRLEGAGLLELRRAMASADKERASRARQCVAAIERATHANIAPSVVRLVVRKKLPQAIPVLLDYVPFGAADQAIEEEIYYGINDLGTTNAEIHTNLIKALTDPAPERRALAACIIGRVGNKQQRADVRKLLRDTDSRVRLRAAQGLLAREDKAGIPTLVELLGEPTLEVSWSAEELLHYAAGTSAPSETVGGGSEVQRTQCRKAWKAWWGNKAETVDLVAARTCRRPGLVIVCDWLDPAKKNGRLLLLGCGGRARWSMNLDDKPTDIHVLSGNRVLVGEYNAGRASERMPEGAVVRVFPGGRELRQVSCRRLVDGSTRLGIDDGNPEYLEYDAGDTETLRRELRVDRWAISNVCVLDTGTVFGSAPNRQENWSAVLFDSESGQLILRTALPNTIRGLDWRIFPATSGGIIALNPSDRSVQILDLLGRPVRALKVEDLEPASIVAMRSGGYLISGRVGPSLGCVAHLDQHGKLVQERVFYGSPHAMQDCFGLLRLGFATSPETEPTVDSVATRVAQLRDADDAVRIRAVHAICRHGPKATAAIPALLDGLDRPQPADRGFYEGALRHVGEPALPSLIGALKDSREAVRAGAANVLAAFPADGTTVVPALITQLKDGSPLVRRCAASSLGAFRTMAWHIVPALTSVLSDTDAAVCAAAAASLGAMGPEAKDAIPALLRAAGSTKNPSVRSTVFASIEHMGIAAKDAVPELISFAQADGFSEFRIEIVRAIGAAQSEGKAAMPLLVAYLGGPDLGLVKEAANTIGLMGSVAEECVPALIKVLRDVKRRGAHLAVVAALGNIGPSAKAAIPILKDLERAARNNETRLAIGNAIQKINR